MKLIVCCLCAGPEPFACPFKFRRSYMALHLEKTHGLPVKDLEFARHGKSDGRSAVWTASSDQRSEQVLLEVEFSLPEMPAEMPGRVQPAHKGSGRQNPPEKVTAKTRGSPWTPTAMQELYRERDLRPA